METRTSEICSDVVEIGNHVEPDYGYYSIARKKLTIVGNPEGKFVCYIKPKKIRAVNCFTSMRLFLARYNTGNGMQIKHILVDTLTEPVT